MTDQRDEIEQVIAKWREAPAYALSELGHRAYRQRRECADELEAVLRRSRAVPPEIGSGAPVASCLICGQRGALAIWYAGTRQGVCERCRRAAQTEPAESSSVAPPPTAGKPSIEQLHGIVSTLANFIWTKQLRPGEHLWTIPVDPSRDFDCLLATAIDELARYRGEPAETRAVLPAQNMEEWVGRSPIDATYDPVLPQCYVDGITAPLVVCERCQMRLPERLVTFGVGVRGGTAARCAACAPQPGPEGGAKRAEVIALRKAKRAFSPDTDTAPSQVCDAPAPDRSRRTCDKPLGHDGPHWTYGGNTLTWDTAPSQETTKDKD